MAESVDALVSNTCGCKAVPVRPRLWVQRLDIMVSGRCLFETFQKTKAEIIANSGLIIFFNLLTLFCHEITQRYAKQTAEIM